MLVFLLYEGFLVQLSFSNFFATYSYYLIIALQFIDNGVQEILSLYLENDFRYVVVSAILNTVENLATAGA